MNDQRTVNAQIAGQLSDAEHEALKRYAETRVKGGFWDTFIIKGLIQETEWGDQAGFALTLTAKGLAVLSHLATETEQVGQPAVITVSELVENLSEWAVFKDAGKINLIWKDDHIDGIGKVGENFVIQYGGIVNDPDYVTGDTLIQIEWLTAPKPTTDAPSAAALCEWCGLNPATHNGEC